MRGIVRGFNRKRGMVAVETEYGYTVFEVLGPAEISMDDTITGDLDTHGREELRDAAGQTFSAYIEAIQATPAAARRLIS